MKIIEEFGHRIKRGELLSRYTTFRIGGPAEFYFEAKSKEEIIKALSLAREDNLPIFILGGGSKVLVSDKGFKGLIIRNLASNIRICAYRGKLLAGKMEKEVFLEAESGAFLNRLVRFSIDEDLSGLEYFLGLPGTVGGAVYNNAHFKDRFIGNQIVEVEVLDKKREIKRLKRNELRFGYDKSVFQKKDLTLLSAIFSLRKGKKEELWQEANAALLWRKDNQPLGFPSAGCIFKNNPNFTDPVGYLIESTGLKGIKIGGAQISPIHANFIVNIGGARSSDVIELINLIKAKVKDKYGINLEEEIICLGEF